MARVLKKQEGEHELRPDGWERFEKAVDAAIASGPKHRTGKSSKAASEKSKKVEKGK
ncbi:MAG: hypothetical protein ACLP7P_03710 [Rhodomicrobium sp.]